MGGLTYSRPIADILLEYNAVVAAIADILNGAQSGSMNSGGGSTSFTKADLKTLIQQRRDLWDEYVEARDEQVYNQTGLQNIIFRRIL